MGKNHLMTCAAILSIVWGARASSQFEAAPVPTPSSTGRLARTMSNSAHVGISKRPMRGGKGIARNASGNGPLIYGMMQYSDSWYDLPDGSGYPYGCYEMSKSYSKPREMYAHPNLQANGGGCYTDRQVHYRLWELLTEDPYFNNYYMVVNTDDWYYVQDPILAHEQNSIANDMTYDPVSKRIYASVWGNFDGGASKLAIVDPTSGLCSEIATIPEMACIAANNFGELYGVEMKTGTTYRIDKNTGECFAIGQSGVSPLYMQSACVDPETNVIYWLATLSDESAGIYTIDTSTGAAALYMDLPDNDEFTCAFIEAPTKGLNAPAALENFSVTAGENGSVVNFNVPVKAFDGSQLGSGTLKALVFVDGRKVDTRDVSPGMSVSITVGMGDGSHTVLAYVENSVGAGPKSVCTHYTGSDVPAAPSDVRLSVIDNVASLSWTAPTAGLHGGTINADELAYNVVRYPGAIEVAPGLRETSFSETLPSGMANYYYTVTSLIGEEVGGSATSNSFFAGSAFDIPYHEAFDSEDAIQGFTILDGDGDGASWDYTDFWKAVWSKYNKYEQSDNWLITPPIKVSANSSYRVSLRARAFDEESAERFEVMAGKSPVAEAMTVNVIPGTITNSEDFAEYSGVFHSDADGVIYIGVHAISPADSYRLIVDDIDITLAASANVPAAVADLKAVAASDGSGSVELSFTVPSTTYSGATLEKLDCVEIFRNNDSAPVKRFDNPSAGQHLSWTDPEAPAGDVVYRVCASNESGRGVEASVSVFVGFDKPMPASDLELVFTDDRELVLSWKAPASTVGGHRINPDKLSYTIWRNDGTKIAENIMTTSFTDTSRSLYEQQSMAYYQVDVFYGDKQSDPAVSDFVLVGTPLTIPFRESFAGKTLENTPWVISRLSGQQDMRWSLQSQASNPDATAQDGDGGFASFVSFDQPQGIMERMTSPKIDLFTADHPVLRFYIYETTAQAGETLTIQISNNDNVFHTLQSVPIKGDSNGWKEICVEIPRKYCTESAMISLLGTTARGFNMHVDNIRIENGDGELYDYDLEAVDLKVPDMMPDVESTVTLTVYNNGNLSIDDYSVALYANGQKVITSNADKPIAPGETYQYLFRLTPEQSDLNETFRFKGSVIYARDMNPANNETEEVTVVVGVSSIEEAGIATDSTISVYTLNGICVISDGCVDDLNTLSEGVYIIRSSDKVLKLVIPAK